MKKSIFAKIIMTVIIALLVPILSYTIFQLAQRDEDEALIKSIYERQINSILFSVNQYCWDIFNSWSSELTTLTTANIGNHSNNELDSTFQQFMKSYDSIVGLFLKYSDQEQFIVVKDDAISQAMQRKALNKIVVLLKQSPKKISKIVQHAQEGYIRPIIMQWKDWAETYTTLLVFPLIHETEVMLVGIFVDNITFVDEIVARKLDAMDEGDFIFAIREHDAGDIIYSTSEEQDQEFERSEKLWIIPDLELLVKLKGTTLAQISEARTRRNLVFVIFINVILIIGVFYLLRNISKEMALAQMKTDFVANVSHELRTPLALIRMHAETLEMGRVPSEEKKHRYYQTIMNESARLTQLINNILDFSKIESRKKEYQLVPTNLVQLVYETIGMYRFHFEQKGFQLEQNIESDLPHIKIDKEAITLALVNLLDNAIKFSTDKKLIHVSLKEQNKKLILTIKDFGIGIPEKEQKKIFDKFYRVGSSLVHNTKGSGLGLSLVKHIMEIHHGEITVKSKIGEGSTFSLVFPIK